jgi:hypothetical protein
MCWSRRLLLCCLLVTSPLLAQTGTPAAAGGSPWLLLLALQSDEDAYQNLSAIFHLGLADATWLSLAAGTSKAPDTEPDIRAGRAGIGIEHDFGPVGLRVNAERWGDSGNLETRDWLGELFLRRDRYRLGISYIRREIDIYFSGETLLRDLRRAELDATGLGLSGRLRVAPRWQLYGSWADYDYPRRVRVVPRADRLNLLSASAITLAYSLIDQYSSVGIERDFGAALVNLDLGRDRSAIDGIVVRSVSMSVLWPVARRLDLEFTLGQSRSASYGSNLYGGLSFLIYGT